ncbi:hypothetical protein SAMN03159353_101655 [Cedecea sp. NFIX57]|nr:hypothetical protein SAMN03159353_101655 [Cedecea sp. NFIX57]
MNNYLAVSFLPRPSGERAGVRGFNAYGLPAHTTITLSSPMTRLKA